MERTAASGITKDQNERLIESETGSDVTSLDHPTEGKKNEVSMGEDIARGIISGLSSSGVLNQNQTVEPKTYGHLTGKIVSLKPGDVVGYYPLRGGKNKWRGGWFKASKDDRVNKDMQIIAAVKNHASYDEGQGVLYHDLKFVIACRYSEHSGELVKMTVDQAIQEACK